MAEERVKGKLGDQDLDCDLFEGVCHLRREDGFCPLHAQLQKMQDQIAWLEEAGYVDKETLEASKNACDM